MPLVALYTAAGIVLAAAITVGTLLRGRVPGRGMHTTPARKRSPPRRRPYSSAGLV